MQYNSYAQNNYQNALKYNPQNTAKTFDKSLPNANIKHYASNPNISLEYTYPKNNVQPEQNNYNYQPLNKNIDFRSQMSSPTSGYERQPQGRPMRNN